MFLQSSYFSTCQPLLASRASYCNPKRETKQTNNHIVPFSPTVVLHVVGRGKGRPSLFVIFVVEYFKFIDYFLATLFIK